MASRKAKVGMTGVTPSERLPGRKPGPSERDEMLRIYDALGDDGRKLVLFVSRYKAKEEGLIAPGESLVITDRAF
jgi:hypothetical protein